MVSSGEQGYPTKEAMKVRLQHLAILTAIILVLHYRALYLETYHDGSEPDNLMHLMGGGLGALVWLWAVQHPYLGPRLGRSSVLRTAITTVGMSVIASYLWEVYEWFQFLYNPAYIYEDSIPDTLLDIGMALIGAAITAGFYYGLETRAGATQTREYTTIDLDARRHAREAREASASGSPRLD